MRASPMLPSQRSVSPSSTPNAALLTNWIGDLLSFEAMFLLYLFAGRFKADPRFEFIPVDLTGLFLCLSGLAAALACFQKSFTLPRKCPRFLAVSALFFGYLVLSYLWSCSVDYAWDKCLYVGILTFYSTVACAVVMSSSRQRVQRFSFLLVGFALWIAIERLASVRGNFSASSDYLLGGNYLGVGRVVGMATIICLVYGLKDSRTLQRRNLLYLGVGFFSIVLLLVGGRMPCLATLAAAGVVLLASRNRSKTTATRHHGSVVAMIFVSVVAAYFFWSYGSNQSSFRTIRRLEVLFTDSDFGSSGSARVELWNTSIELWAERPLFGHGLGSFPVLYWNEDIRGYSHNLFLELGVETGLIGVLLLFYLMYYAYRSFVKNGRVGDDPQRLLIFALLVNTFCNAMVSGDIPDNRAFFGLLGLTCLIDRKAPPREKNRPSHVRTLSV